MTITTKKIKFRRIKNKNKSRRKYKSKKRRIITGRGPKRGPKYRYIHTRYHSGIIIYQFPTYFDRSQRSIQFLPRIALIDDNDMSEYSDEQYLLIRDRSMIRSNIPNTTWNLPQFLGDETRICIVCKKPLFDEHFKPVYALYPCLHMIHNECLINTFHAFHKYYKNNSSAEKYMINHETTAHIINDTTLACPYSNTNGFINPNNGGCIGSIQLVDALLCKKFDTCTLCKFKSLTDYPYTCLERINRIDGLKRIYQKNCGALVMPSDECGGTRVMPSDECGGARVMPSDECGGARVMPSDECGGIRVISSDECGGTRVIPSDECGGTRVIPSDECGGTRVIPSDECDAFQQAHYARFPGNSAANVAKRQLVDDHFNKLFNIYGHTHEDIDAVFRFPKL